MTGGTSVSIKETKMPLYIKVSESSTAKTQSKVPQKYKVKYR